MADVGEWLRKKLEEYTGMGAGGQATEQGMSTAVGNTPGSDVVIGTAEKSEGKSTGPNVPRLQEYNEE